MRRETFAGEFVRSVKSMRAQGIRPEKIASDLGISMGTFFNWYHPETANVDLETVEKVSDYFGWEVEVSQRETIGSHSACSDNIVLDLREHEPVLVLA